MINYSFLIAGHTKFAPDRCFGLITCAYKVNYVSSIYEFARMVDSSSTVGVNKSQLVGTHDGRVIVPVYDWVIFLSQYFNKLPSMKKYRVFRFSTDEPGKVYVKEYKSSPEHTVMLLKDRAVVPRPSLLPHKLKLEGLSEERNNYLYREIRPFCKPGTKDLVSPAP